MIVPLLSVAKEVTGFCTWLVNATTVAEQAAWVHE